MKRVAAVRATIALSCVIAFSGFTLADGERDERQTRKSRSKQERPVAVDPSIRHGPKNPTSSKGPPRIQRPRVNRCTVRVQPPDASAASRRREVSFSARQISDLRFDVWLLESRSSEPAEVRVYAPGNRLYKVLRVSPSPSAVTAQASRRLSRRGVSVLSAPMPLVGTHVTSRSLYGEWHVEGWFVGAEEPCSRSMAFFLEP